MPAASPATPSDAGRPGGRSRLAGPILAALLGFAVGDSLRPAADQVSARLGVAAIDAYRAAVSPMLSKSGVVRCRFEPTCSAYAREAVLRHGSPRGFALAAGRVLRCHPWAKGGPDPVP